MIKKVIADGYSGVAGLSKLGWYGAALLLKDTDDIYTEQIPYKTWTKRVMKDGFTFEEWLADSTMQKRRLLFIEEKEDGSFAESELASADRIYGPVIPKGKNDVPVVVWSQMNDQNWQLCMKKGSEVTNVKESSRMIRTPSTASLNDEYYIATLVDTEQDTKIEVYKEDGSIYFSCNGGRPILCSTGKSLFMLCENPEPKRSEISLILYDITSVDNIKKWRLSVEDINIQGDMISDDEGVLYVSWESMPSWGVDHGIARHKNINVWKFDGEGEPKPLKGDKGTIDLPREAIADGLDGIKSNISTTNPKLTIIKGKPVLLFKRFTIRKYKINGWDVCWTRWDGSNWMPFERLTENYGTPDTDYDVIDNGEYIYGFFSSCEFEKWNKSKNHRTELCAFTIDKTLSMMSVPLSIKGPYEYLYSVKGAGVDPTDLDVKNGELKLVWGDIHTHTSYSKCMSSIDGTVDENIRYCRDLLGCKVLTITDHYRLMSVPEIIWTADKLEENCYMGCFIMYGGEPGTAPDHHTNVYTVDREIYDRMRNLSQIDREDWYKSLKENLPESSVIALRHYHGNGGPEGIGSEKTLQTWDPALEVAMESMQCRGNVMMSNYGNENIPKFPSNFLNAGAKIGLVAGTDHTLDAVLNYVCFTGFWVKEVTPEGIWEAINQRRTIACANGKAAVWTELDGKPMGSEVTVSGDVKINIQLSSAFGLKRICLLKDGVPLEWRAIEGNTYVGTLEDKNPEKGYHWYSVTVECNSVYSEPAPFTPVNYFSSRNKHNNILVHASPYFVTVE